MKTSSLEGLYDARTRSAGVAGAPASPRWSWTRLWFGRAARPAFDGRDADERGHHDRSASVSALMEGQRWGLYL